MPRTPIIRDDVVRVLGAADELAMAEILATGATAEELAEARNWLESDEPLLNTGRPLADGRVAALVDILSRADEDKMPPVE